MHFECQKSHTKNKKSEHTMSKYKGESISKQIKNSKHVTSGI